MQVNYKPLVIQFSGGRSSAFMSRFLLDYKPIAQRPKLFLFENTGKEREETLEFVLKCDREWGLNVQWLEAVVHHGERRASSHKIVDYKTASRQGEPFLEVIKKYGLPNLNRKHCTRELKINPFSSYLRGLGLKRGDYDVAIGIRADEEHRIKRDAAAREHIIYPLVDMIRATKAIVREFWDRQSFDLELRDYEGNCDFCFEKSLSKLVTLARENPEKLSWWEDVGAKYAATGAGAESSPRQMYRGYRTAQDIREIADSPTLFDHLS